MNEEQLTEFIQQCQSELEQKQSYLVEEFGLGKYQRFDVQLDKEVIEFKASGTVKVVAKIIPIGSFAERAGTWMWAWANPSIPELLQNKSSKLKELKRITGIKIFEKETLVADEKMSWEIAAMSCHYLRAKGCYRANSGKSLFFLALQEVNSL